MEQDVVYAAMMLEVNKVNKINKNNNLVIVLGFCCENVARLRRETNQNFE